MTWNPTPPSFTPPSFTPASFSQSSPTPPSFTIDCADCTMAHTDACADCVVTFICSREPGDAVVVDLAEYRAIELLAESGLVPELRHRSRRTG